MDVILVDNSDEELGSAEKMEAHRQGLLHRAFSVLVFNSKDELLIQKRSSSKYHSGGLWTNTCCSHPAPGEQVLDAAHRRLKEELGFDCPLREACCFHYRAVFDNGIVENEMDHIFVGRSDAIPHPDSSEVEACRHISIPDLKKEMHDRPEDFTFWFREIIQCHLPPIKDVLGRFPFGFQ